MDANKVLQSILVGLITLVIGTLVEKGVIHHFKTCSENGDISKKPVKETSLILLGILMNLLPDGIHLVKKFLR